MKEIIKEIEDVWDKYPKPCLNPEHKPPMYLHIEPGRIYIHVCPACGFRAVLRGSDVTW